MSSRNFKNKIIIRLGAITIIVIAPNLIIVIAPNLSNLQHVGFLSLHTSCIQMALKLICAKDEGQGEQSNCYVNSYSLKVHLYYLII